jgi:hypothetical protein
MNSYINNFINSDSEDLYYLFEEKPNKIIQKGGNNLDKPNGGFPPIYLLEKSKTSNDKKKNRLFHNKGNSINIVDILNSKK